MEIDEIGSTAFVIAGFRAIEAEREQPLFEDRFAASFINDEIRGKLDQLIKVLPEVESFIRFRTCIFNSLVQNAISDGVEQIVVLGAGFDMRAHIFGAESVEFFEVDQPAVLNFKSKIAESLGVKPCTGVPCNYLEVDVTEMLVESGYNPNKRSFFVWEGNTMYLPTPMIFSFLNRLSERNRQMSIAFDFISGHAIYGGDGYEEVFEIVQRIQSILQAKFVSGFNGMHEFEEKTPLKIAEFNSLLGGAQTYLSHLPDEFFEKIREEERFMQEYCYGRFSQNLNEETDRTG